MNVNSILQQLNAERDRLAKAIEALIGIGGGKAPREGRRGRRPKGRPKATAAPAKRGRRARRPMSAAAKAKLSRLMKQRWAARKKAGKSKLGA